MVVWASKTWGPNPKPWPNYYNARFVRRAISPRANKRIRKKYTAKPRDVARFERLVQQLTASFAKARELPAYGDGAGMWVEIPLNGWS